MSDGRDAFARYRERLDAVGFRPSSARGQNFLLDPTLHRWIAAAAAPGPADLALEIGVGLGFLTRELAASGAAVVGVEIDERLYAIARAELAPFANVELVLADALGGDPAAAGGEEPGGGLHPAVRAAVAARLPAHGAFLVVANLPYSASGPLLAHLACLPRVPDRIVVLVQRELADRLAARPGGREFGGLSAQLQALFTVEVLRTVPPEVFRPRPKVASAVVRLTLRADAELPRAADRRGFQVFVRALFAKRRKVLRTTLAEAAAAIGGSHAGVATDWHLRRAEQLSVAELVALWRLVRPAVPAGEGAPTLDGPTPASQVPDGRVPDGRTPDSPPQRTG